MFTRWMFYQRRGYIWQRANHHALICNALERVFNGETKRLIINIPPRYSKTRNRGRELHRVGDGVRAGL